MIKKTLLLVAIIALSFIFPAAIQAQSFHIELGDRPYYSHGPTYWDNDWEMVWVQGHWSEYGHHWIHGHYVRGKHHRHHHHHDDDNNYNEYNEHHYNH
jgi:hypothetical protein